MKALYDVGEQTFSWRPVKGVTKTIKGVTKTIEVYAGPDIFGTLRQDRGQPAVAETTAGRWTFATDKKTITAHDADGAVVATFVAGKGGEGVLTLADGEVVRWAPTRQGTAERAFYDAAGRRIVRFWRDWQLLKVEDRGAADPGMAAHPAFPLLVVLGRYIGLGMDDDGGTIAAVVAATS